MNMSELAGLIAHTMNTPGTLLGPPLSPKQQLQSTVRQLHRRHGHRQARSESEVERTPPRSAQTDLHHVASLRPHHNRSVSALPRPAARTVLSDTTNNVATRRPRTPRDGELLGFDFSAEEREAWSKKSPGTPANTSSGRHLRKSSSHSSLLVPPEAILYPPTESANPVPQPQKHRSQPPILKNFAAFPTELNDEERPKTSRGPRSRSAEPGPRFTSERGEPPMAAAEDENTARRLRHSKFLEGSMNERSVAVASSWYHSLRSDSDATLHDNTLSCSEDSNEDDKPRASKLGQEFGVFQTPALKPLPDAPTTAKKGLFRFGGSSRTSEDIPRPAGDKVDPKARKGLRKSMSIWNLQALGDKIKTFGHHTSDTASTASSETATTERSRLGHRTKRNPTAGRNSTETDLLDDRKRKAEEEYAKQFGLKKQKSNTGLATQPGVTPAAAKNKNEKPSVTPKTLFRRKRGQDIAPPQPRLLVPQQPQSADLRKKPSRRDLEKENQHLRAMLRQSNSMTFNQSSVHLPLAHEAPVILSPGKNQGRRGEDIPPVPQLPEKQVLQELGNRASRRISQRLDKARAVSTIVEEDEGEPMLEDENAILPHRGQQWEWPEDVF